MKPKWGIFIHIPMKTEDFTDISLPKKPMIEQHKIPDFLRRTMRKEIIEKINKLNL